MPLVSSHNAAFSNPTRMGELATLSLAERPWRRHKRSEAAQSPPLITITDVGSKDTSSPDIVPLSSDELLLDVSSKASSDVGADVPVTSSRAVAAIGVVPDVLAGVVQNQETWNADLWLQARDELLQSGEVRHMNELLQTVGRSTDQAVSLQSYKVGSQSFQLRSTPLLATGLTWFGQENAGHNPIESDNFADAEKTQNASAIHPPVLVCAASPLDVVVHLRNILGEDQPIILVADVADFDSSGNADLRRPSAVRPQCLPLRTDFKKYAVEAAASLKGGSSTMQSHLCARFDPYVFLCPNVTVFRGSREAGYPFLSTPIRAHVIATAQAEARPSVQMLLGSSGQTEWYSDERAHAALLDRLNLISLVALNKAACAEKGNDSKQAGEKPILILGTFGCGGGRSGRHPHHAVANALKHWRQHFSPFFRSIFVCCERDGGHGDPARAALLDRIINRQVYRTLDNPSLAASLSAWHWDIRQLQLCIRPTKLMKVYQMCDFVQSQQNHLTLGLQPCHAIDHKETDSCSAEGAPEREELLPRMQCQTVGKHLTCKHLDSLASIRKVSTLVVVGGSSLQCSVSGGSPFPGIAMTEQSSDDSFESSSSEPEGTALGRLGKSRWSCQWSRTSNASIPHSRRGSSHRGSTVQHSRQVSKESSSMPPESERRLSLSLFGWKSSNSRRASMLSRRSSAQSSRRASEKNPDSQRPSMLMPDEGGPNRASLTIPDLFLQDTGASPISPDSYPHSGRSSLAAPDDILASGRTSLVVPERELNSTSLSLTPVSLAIPEHGQLNTSGKTKSPSSRSHSRRTSVSNSPQSPRRASVSGAGGGNGRRLSCGQRLGPLARRLSISGDTGRRASVSQITNRRCSLGGELGQFRRFSTNGQLCCLPEQDCEKPARRSGGSRTSSFSSSHHSGEESDTNLDDVQKNRIAGELAERVEDIELLKRSSFETLTKQLHKEQTRMMRRRSTLADLIGSSDLASLNVAHESNNAQGGFSARASPSRELKAKPNVKHHAHLSREEVDIRRQVRERLRIRRQKICCRRGAGSLIFAQHAVPQGLSDGGDDCLDERPATSLTGAEQLQSGRRLSTFTTICNARNFVLGRT